MLTPAEKVIEVYAASRGRAACRGKTCGQSLLWARVVLSGAAMCFTGDPKPLYTRTDADGREIVAYPLSANHWSTCPDRQRFKKAARPLPWYKL